MGKGDMTAAEYVKRMEGEIRNSAWPAKSQRVRKQDEHDLQVAIFTKIIPNLMPLIPELKYMHSTLNGARLHPATARKMKMTGLRSGPPDIYWDLARRGFYSLRIELKTASGVVSLAQKDWHKFLEREGHCCMVVRDQNAFTDLVLWYYGIENEKEKRDE